MYWLAVTGTVAGIGFLLACCALYLQSGILLAMGGLLVTPLIIWANLLCIWHWKERYVGDHSQLWGALLILETTGWMKLVYVFRHLLPDYYARGRYLHART